MTGHPPSSLAPYPCSAVSRASGDSVGGQLFQEKYSLKYITLLQQACPPKFVSYQCPELSATGLSQNLLLRELTLWIIVTLT